jgi:hypothetical protein
MSGVIHMQFHVRKLALVATMVLTCAALNAQEQLRSAVPAQTDFQRSASQAEPKAKDEPSTAPVDPKPRLFPPITWGCEDEWKLQMSGDVRVRWEHRDNWDMNKSRDDDDNITFLRSRFHFDLTYDSFIRAFVTVMDARQFGVRSIYDGGVDPRQEDHFDILQAFIELHEKDSPWTLRVGRQTALNLGENRLIETSSWSNLQRAFEGVWLTHKTKEHEIHAFLLQELIYQTRRGDDIITDRMRNKTHEWFYGLYGTFKYLDPHEFDLYFFGTSDRNDNRVFPSSVTSEQGRFGTTDRYTVGTRWRGPLYKDECGTLGYGFETAYQFGHRSSDDIRAYMLHLDLNYTWDHPWKPKVVLEGNVASGDRVWGDGETNTFVTSYGASHTPYGVIDFTRLSNLREIALSGHIEPNDKTKLRLELHKYWLDSRTDAWYSAVPGSFPRDRSGQSGRDIGGEIDVVGSYKVNKWATVEVGAAHFFPGNFAKKHGRHDAANYFYVQTVFNF